MSNDVTREEAIDRRFELDEQIAVIQGRQKAELAPLVEEMHLCEQFVKSDMLSAGAQQTKTAGGHQCFFTTKDSVTVADWDAVLREIVFASPPMSKDGKTVTPEQWNEVLTHILATANWSLLNRAVNKTVVKEIIEERKVPPPGVKYESFRDLSWRRGKA